MKTEPGTPEINPSSINPSKIKTPGINPRIETGEISGKGVSPEVIELEGNPEKPGDLSREEQVEELDSKITGGQESIDELTELVKSDKAEMNKAREELELPPNEETLATEKALEESIANQEKLEAEKRNFEEQQEKERLIQEEKEKILQERVNSLFNQFNNLSSSDFKIILKNEGFDSKTSKSLTKLFKEGIKLLSEIIKNIPEILEKFDEELIDEATKRVEKRLEREQNKERDEEKTKEESTIKGAFEAKEVKTEIPKNTTKSNEPKLGNNK